MRTFKHAQPEELEAAKGSSLRIDVFPANDYRPANRLQNGYYTLTSPTLYYYGTGGTSTAGPRGTWN